MDMMQLSDSPPASQPYNITSPPLAENKVKVTLNINGSSSSEVVIVQFDSVVCVYQLYTGIDKGHKDTTTVHLAQLSPTGLQMFFFTDAQLNNLLFKGLDITTTSGMVGASFVVFGATILFELLKLVKLYLDLKLQENPLPSQNTSEEIPEESRETNHDGVILLNSLRIPVVRQIRARKLNLHVLSCLSHTINVFYGYLLMLVVMTYSVWLTVAVVVGSAVGYWIFGAIGQLLRETSFQATHQSVMGKHQMPHSETVQARGDL